LVLLPQDLRGPKLSKFKISITPGWTKPFNFDIEKLQLPGPSCHTQDVTQNGYGKLEYFRTKFVSAGNKRLFMLMPHLNHEAPDFLPPGCVPEGN